MLSGLTSLPCSVLVIKKAGKHSLTGFFAFSIPFYRLLIQPFAKLDRITEVAEYRTTARVKPDVYHLYRWVFVMKKTQRGC